MSSSLSWRITPPDNGAILDDLKKYGRLDVWIER